MSKYVFCPYCGVGKVGSDALIICEHLIYAFRKYRQPGEPPRTESVFANPIASMRSPEARQELDEIIHEATDSDDGDERIPARHFGTTFRTGPFEWYPSDGGALYADNPNRFFDAAIKLALEDMAAECSE